MRGAEECVIKPADAVPVSVCRALEDATAGFRVSGDGAVTVAAGRRTLEGRSDEQEGRRCRARYSHTIGLVELRAMRSAS